MIVALPGHLADDEPGAIADQLGIDVLVGVLGPGDGARVQPRLVGERRRTDVRRLWVDRSVEQLGDVVADGGQSIEATLRKALVAELELEVGDDRRQVGVSGALAEPVQRPLDLTRAGQHGGHRVGHRASGVVVAVDSERDVGAEVGVDGSDDLRDLVRERPAVGVAQHEVAGTLHDGRLERPQRELGVGLVAVEEVLGVDEHASAVADEELDRVGDHRLTLVQRGLQRLRDVVLRALGDDADRRRPGVDEVAQRGVVVDLATRSARRAERNERARCQPQLCRRAGEELDVLRVGTGPAALDVVHAEHVELFGDAQLVLDGRRHALDLEAVTQRCVEDLDGSLVHGAHWFWLFAQDRPRERKKPPGGGFGVHVGQPACTRE